MKKLALLLAVLFLISADLIDRKEFIILQESSSVANYIKKNNVKQVIKSGGKCYLQILGGQNIKLDYDDFNNIYDNDEMSNIVSRMVNNAYDSTVYTYTGANVNAIKYYLDSTLQYTDTLIYSGSNVINQYSKF